MIKLMYTVMHNVMYNFMCNFIYTFMCKFMCKFLIKTMNIFKLHRKWAWAPAQAQGLSGSCWALVPVLAGPWPQSWPSSLPGLNWVRGGSQAHFRCNFKMFTVLIMKWYMILYMKLYMNLCINLYMDL